MYSTDIHVVYTLDLFLCVCVYVCTMSTALYVKFIRISVRFVLYACMYIHGCIQYSTFVYMCNTHCVCACVCMYVCTYACIYVRMHVYMYVCMYINYVCTIYVCINVCIMYTCILLDLY